MLSLLNESSIPSVITFVLDPQGNRGLLHLHNRPRWLPSQPVLPLLSPRRLLPQPLHRLRLPCPRCYSLLHWLPPPPAPPAPSAPPAPIASMTYASPANSWVIAAAVVGDAAALFLSATGGAPASSPFLSAGTGSVAASGNGVWQLPRKTECGTSPTGLRWLLLANQGLEWQRRVPLQMLGALAAEGRGPLARRLQPVRYVFAYCKKIGKITNRVI